MGSKFTAEMQKRNEDKWAAVPCYIDFLLMQQRYDRPIAASIDIDGTMFHEKTRTLMQNCVEALKYIKTRGCAIFIVTARSSAMRPETVYELGQSGITTDLYQTILFRDAKRDTSHKQSKLAHRNTIRETHDLIFAVGDRTIDLIDLNEDEGDYCSLNLMMENMTQY